MSFKVLQIDHVELYVPDRYEAAKWYERVLGLEIVGKAEHWARTGGPLMISSDDGSTKLALFEGEPSPAPQTAAFRRVAFRVTAQGFDQFLSRLPDPGINSGRDQPITRDAVVDHQQAYSIYFNDPYGHQLEITTYEYDELTARLAR